MKTGKTAAKRREQQTRYLSQAIQLEEAVNPRIVGTTMTMVSAAVFSFVLWSGMTNINEVARASGEVVPSGYQKVVQHLEGGMVKAILVREGDVVEGGQPLVVLDGASIGEDLDMARKRQMFLDMQAERLRAFVEGREPDFSIFPGAPAQMVSEQRSFFEGMRTAREKESQIIRDQIGKKEMSLAPFRSDLETARKNREIVNDIYERRRALGKKGYAPEVQILEDRRRLNEISGEIGNIENQIKVARTEIDEFRSRLESLAARHRDEAQEKLDLVLAEKDQNAAAIKKLEEREGRLEIKAPARGLVKGLTLNTVGAVVQPGQTIMEIVPLDEKLVVQVRISPKDIGRMEAGRPVQVKFSAYDFSRYGVARGHLERISATTFSGEGGDRYYEGRVVLDRSYVGNSPENAILPGMTVMADIITGRKTILQYMLKPIHSSLQTAFTER